MLPVGTCFCEGTGTKTPSAPGGMETLLPTTPPGEGNTRGMGAGSSRKMSKETERENPSAQTR